MNEYREIKQKILHAFRDLDYKYTPGTLLILSDMLNKLEKEIRDTTREQIEEASVIIGNDVISKMHKLDSNEWLFIYRFDPERALEQTPEQVKNKLFHIFYEFMQIYVEDKYLKGELKG